MSSVGDFMRRSTIAAVVLAVASAVLAGGAAAADSSPQRTLTVTRPPDTRSAGTGQIDPTFGVRERSLALDAARREAETTARRIGLSAAEELVVKDVVRDADGTLHLRFDRLYAGLAVVAGDLVVHQGRDGRLLGVDRASDADLSRLPSVGARVSPSAAAAAARRASGLRDVLSQSPSRRVVYAVGDEPLLAWESVLSGSSAEGPQRDVVYIDARSGALVNRWSLTRRAEGPGHSLYSGTVRVKTVLVSGRYRLRDNTRGGHRTHDAGSRVLPIDETGAIFTDADNRWGNGTTSSRQSAAVDAHYGIATAWDFFASRFNRSGVRNDGVGVVSRVHYGRPGTVAAGNAFWDDRCFCVTFGSGNQEVRPLVSLDVVGHEMTHGITSRTAGLLYVGESGGLDEATSDIFGTMVEFSAGNRNDPGDYLIGEEITKVAPGFVRRLDRPRADGASYNCWTATMGRDDVHFSSGPANHFFYLLAEGTARKTIGGRVHSSSTCNGTQFGGIGRAVAARIWYRALDVYMTSTTDYADARDATVRAARDIYGSGSTTCRAVARTWEAVSVKLQNENCFGPLTASDGANAVANGGFEGGDNGDWTAPANSILDDPAFGFPHSGRWWAYLSGYAEPITDVLEQNITVPTGSVQLRVQLLISTNEPPSAGPRDVLRLRVTPAGGTAQQVASWSNVQASDTYSQRVIDLSSFAGQNVTLQFVGQEDGNLNATAFFVDDVQVRGD
jgi:Zn-dependent metalloprotease